MRTYIIVACWILLTVATTSARSVDAIVPGRAGDSVTEHVWPVPRDAFLTRGGVRMKTIRRSTSLLMPRRNDGRMMVLGYVVYDRGGNVLERFTRPEVLDKMEPRWQEVLLTMRVGEVKRIWIRLKGQRELSIYDVQLRALIK